MTGSFSAGSEVSTGSLALCSRFQDAASTLAHVPRRPLPDGPRPGRPPEHSTPWSSRLARGSPGTGGGQVWAHQYGIDTCGCHTDDRFLRGSPKVPAEPVQLFLGASARVGVGSCSFQPLRHLLWALRVLRAIATKSWAIMHQPTYLWKPASPLYQARFIPN